MFSLVLCIYQTFYLFFCRINCDAHKQAQFYSIFIYLIKLKCQGGIGYNCQINHPLFLILFLNGSKTIQIIYLELNTYYQTLLYIFICIKCLNKHSKVFLFSVLPKYRRSAGQILMPRFGIIVFL